MNYISLFSCAGIGCYGFKLENYKCLATVEIEPKRMNIQRYNDKCISDIGYIDKDITKYETKELLDQAIKENLKIIEEKEIDVIIATPPCQGMSALNTKKTTKDLIRNSLVLEAILLVEKYQPKFFIFENVKEFLKSDCTDIDGNNKKINDVIDIHLSNNYEIEKKIINFKEYGSNSSRTRTVVIGVKKLEFQKIEKIDIEYNIIKAKDLYPDKQETKTLYETIGHLKSLKREEIDENDILHFAKKMNEKHYEWMKPVQQGCSAFKNEDINLRPHKIDEFGNRIEFNSNMGGKYSRQHFNKTASCIHTFTNNPASQYTIHPIDTRVFSIKELMLMQGMNENFRWDKITIEELNILSIEEKRNWLSKNEMIIRTVIGESVPTIIFQQIAKKIKSVINTIEYYKGKI